MRQGNIVIDCGANTGQEVEVAAQTGATIYAFEPNPFAYKVLVGKFGGMPNVICFNQGVWDRESTLPLFLHKQSDQDEVMWSTGSSLLCNKNNVDPGKSVDVEIIDLCKFIRGLEKRIKVLKMDVEGVEFDILQKLIDTDLVSQIDLVVVETHEQKIPELRQKADSIRKQIREQNLSNIYLNWF